MRVCIYCRLTQQTGRVNIVPRHLTVTSERTAATAAATDQNIKNSLRSQRPKGENTLSTGPESERGKRRFYIIW